MMSIVQKTEHDCYEHYELRNYEKVFTCDGCKMNGFGQMYQCKLCGHGLHRECRFPRTTISHEHFEGAIFTFHEEPFTRIGINNRREYSKCCDACAKDICGFSYHCEADDLDLHPCCRNLEKKLVINDAVINLPAKSSSKCIWCKKRKISDGCRDVPGWSYSLVSIDDNEYHLHVYCMTEMMHEACMKNEEMTLENIEPRKVAKSSRNRENGANKIFETIKTKRFRKSY